LCPAALESIPVPVRWLPELPHCVLRRFAYPVVRTRRASRAFYFKGWAVPEAIFILAIALALLFGPFLYLALLFAWWASRTKTLRYFGLPSAERRAFRSRVRRYGVLVAPLLKAGLGKVVRPAWLDLRQAGLTLPKSACSSASLADALAWRPGARDVVVATQMKCGTTWMQQIVFELFSRGRGDLGDAGHVHLNAISPWIEAARGVPLAEAPRIGAEGARIIKTHLPASHCPDSPEALYIYVTRHPVSCYLSCLSSPARMAARWRAREWPRLTGSAARTCGGVPGPITWLAGGTWPLASRTCCFSISKL
jgi:hypothetical protein